MSGALLIGYVIVQRLVELFIARKNTIALKARGAYEAGASQYPYIVAFHALWLVTLCWFGWSRPVVTGYLICFIVLQIARVWVLGTLGERWTTRIIMVPWAVPIVSGPFRFVRHPNYVVVALELPCVSLAVGLLWHALLFGVLGLAVIWWRIRLEDAAFARMLAASETIPAL